MSAPEAIPDRASNAGPDRKSIDDYDRINDACDSLGFALRNRSEAPYDRLFWVRDAIRTLQGVEENLIKETKS